MISKNITERISTMSTQESSYGLEEQDLNKTRQVRSDIITALTAKGIPEDLDTLRLLTTVLVDSDRTSLGRMKIKSEDKNSANNAGVASVMAGFLMKVNAGQIAFNGSNSNMVPLLPDTIPAPDILPGETDIGVHNTDFDSFSKEHFKQIE